ncbi:hypothetical protein DIPPA_12872 [Diplonema papillatum]|nr:hypothetical protein DIPPA_12872 [Diplonema papillatum]
MRLSSALALSLLGFAGAAPPGLDSCDGSAQCQQYGDVGAVCSAGACVCSHLYTRPTRYTPVCLLRGAPASLVPVFVAIRFPAGLFEEYTPEAEKETLAALALATDGRFKYHFAVEGSVLISGEVLSAAADATPAAADAMLAAFVEELTTNGGGKFARKYPAAMIALQPGGAAPVMASTLAKAPCWVEAAAATLLDAGKCHARTCEEGYRWKLVSGAGACVEASPSLSNWELAAIVIACVLLVLVCWGAACYGWAALYGPDAYKAVPPKAGSSADDEEQQHWGDGAAPRPASRNTQHFSNADLDDQMPAASERVALRCGSGESVASDESRFFEDTDGIVRLKELGSTVYVEPSETSRHPLAGGSISSRSEPLVIMAGSMNPLVSPSVREREANSRLDDRGLTANAPDGVIAGGDRQRPPPLDFDLTSTATAEPIVEQTSPVHVDVVTRKGTFGFRGKNGNPMIAIQSGESSRPFTVPHVQQTTSASDTHESDSDDSSSAETILTPGGVALEMTTHSRGTLVVEPSTPADAESPVVVCKTVSTISGSGSGSGSGQTEEDAEECLPPKTPVLGFAADPAATAFATRPAAGLLEGGAPMTVVRTRSNDSWFCPRANTDGGSRIEVGLASTTGSRGTGAPGLRSGALAALRRARSNGSLADTSGQGEGNRGSMERKRGGSSFSSSVVGKHQGQRIDLADAEAYARSDVAGEEAAARRGIAAGTTGPGLFYSEPTESAVATLSPVFLGASLPDSLVGGGAATEARCDTVRKQPARGREASSEGGTGACNAADPAMQPGAHLSGEPSSNDGAAQAGASYAAHPATHLSGDPSSKDGTAQASTSYAAHPAMQPGAHLNGEPSSTDSAAQAGASYAAHPATHLSGDPSSKDGTAQAGTSYAAHPAVQPGANLKGDPSSKAGASYAAHPAMQPGANLNGEPSSKDGAAQADEPPPNGASHAAHPANQRGAHPGGKPSSRDGAAQADEASPNGTSSAGHPATQPGGKPSSKDSAAQAGEPSPNSTSHTAAGGKPSSKDGAAQADEPSPNGTSYTAHPADGKPSSKDGAAQAGEPLPNGTSHTAHPAKQPGSKPSSKDSAAQAGEPLPNGTSHTAHPAKQPGSKPSSKDSAAQAGETLPNGTSSTAHPAAPGKPLSKDGAAQAGEPSPHGTAHAAVGTALAAGAAAASKVLRALRQHKDRSRFLKAIVSWKDGEAQRRNWLAKGKAGSLGCRIDARMRVTALAEGCPAEKAGVRVGDLIVVLQCSGRGGQNVRFPVPNRAAFLDAVGPQNEVFEGKSIQVGVVRGEREQRAWLARNLTPPPSRTAPEADAWLRAADEAEAAVDVVVGPESEQAGCQRRKMFAEYKMKRRLRAMNLDLVMDMISDPDKARAFTFSVFASAADASGRARAHAVSSVLEQMTDCCGCDRASSFEAKRLFYAADLHAQGYGTVSSLGSSVAISIVISTADDDIT